MNHCIKIILLFLIYEPFWSQNLQKHIALLNATAHCGDGQIIENSLIVIENDKLITVTSSKGIKLDYRSFDTVYDLSGKHVYPALINANNVLGLHDAEAVRATTDFQEVGFLNPHVRAVRAYNTDNLIVPTIKTNGVLYTQVTPRGGLISGSSSIMALEGWNWEDALVLEDDGIHLNFPMHAVMKWTEEEGLTKAANKKYEEELIALNKFFEEALAYSKKENYNEKDIRLEAMRKIFNGKSNLYIHADNVKDILTAIQFSSKFAIPKPILVGGKESYRLTKELKAAKIPVMLNRLNDLPDKADDKVDMVYATPYLLQKDSVLFCLQMSGDMEAMQSRNLPFNAGEAVAYGLTKEQALAAVTSNVAKIVGVDQLIGTLQEGKLASLVVSEGDILDMRTNNIVLAFIAGKKVDLNNQQSELYNKYKQKYGIK